VFFNSKSAHRAATIAQGKQHLAIQQRFSTPSSGALALSNLGSLVVMAGLVVALSGCSSLPKSEAEAQSRVPGSQQGGGVTPVDVAIAKTGVIREPTVYTGTTRPVREVSLRAQVEGRLLNLNVDTGDPVRQGQILAQVDDSLLVTALSQAQAELAALQAEVARAQTQVQNARAQAEQARAELQQAQVDAARRETLGRQGAISKQEAELAQTAARTAQQTVQAATAQISTEQQAVAAAQRRVEAQRAAVAQAKERQSYALLAAPINGVVLEKSEPGNLIQPGGEVLKLGDFSQVKVVVNSVPDSERANIQVGQSAQVKLDAFPNESFSGRVIRILPVANSIQFTVEITIPNSNGQIGSNLFARVSFEETKAPRVVVPQTALQGGREQGSRGAGEQGSRGAGEQGSNPKSKIQNPKSTEATVFVVTGQGAKAKVQARRVQVGDRANGKVEIISGLKPGERFVARSGKPLKDGEPVRLSVVSEK